ncbi:MAG: spore coat U domain-containing protein [Gammaproteobacteria bacterium]|nr:spore coat U domain-containing protein [Gammaproteobacteria bacterium]MBU1444418.1 spore coat U domain-containing protein [Gammaproteobacteria bacterium]MBU2285027.1 spore coat U domain-containing protein [Gammaproteobacteria bacterium]MBU2407867.1 spore coat U domain-containing protein [Gammaproteobacteria bacterium]
MTTSHAPTFIRHLAAIACACVVAALPVQPASAATATTTFLVSANVLSFCSVTALPLAFGSYSGTQVDTTTTLSVTCTFGTAYSIGLSAGTTSGNSITARRMVRTAGTEVLGYSLFSDSQRSVNWGDTPATNAVAGTGSGLAQSLTVYGRLPAGQTTIPVGAYSDIVTVTVNY